MRYVFLRKIYRLEEKEGGKGKKEKETLQEKDKRKREGEEKTDGV